MAVKKKIKRILGLLGISAKMDLAWLLRDTKFAVIGIFSDLVVNFSTLVRMFLIAARFGGIGGVSTDEVLFMMAYNTLITGIFTMFGSANNLHISRIIGRGQLEHLFIQPLPLGVQLSTCGFSPFTGGGNFVMGIVLLVVAVGRLGLQVTFGWLAMLEAYLVTTMVVLIAQSYMVSSAAFYAPVAAEEISNTAIDETFLLTTFPLGGMPLFVQVPLLTVLPEGLMAWFPSMCLLGKPPFQLAYYPMFFALVIAVLAAYVFKKALRSYVRTGSNRYVPYGFRR